MAIYERKKNDREVEYVVDAYDYQTRQQTRNVFSTIKEALDHEAGMLGYGTNDCQCIRVPYLDLSRLPRHDHNSYPSARHPLKGVPTIYFLIQDGVVVYVGRSNNMPIRIYYHIHTKQKQPKIFDEVRYLVADCYCLALERTYIRRYRPKYNVQGRKWFLI